MRRYGLSGLGIILGRTLLGFIFALLLAVLGGWVWREEAPGRIWVLVTSLGLTQVTVAVAMLWTTQVTCYLSAAIGGLIASTTIGLAAQISAGAVRCWS